MNNHWLKPLNNAIPYLEYQSISKKYRNTWPRNRHSHAICELHMVLQGNAKMEIGETVIELRAGQAILVYPYTFHCNTEISEPFLRISVSFLIKDEFRPQDKSKEPYYIFGVDSDITQTCYEIFEEYDRGDPLWQQEMLSALLSKLLIHVFRTIRQSQPGSVSANLDNLSDFEKIDEFFSISTNHEAKDYSRKALALSLHCSERHLNRLFCTLYGMTFQEKRQLARMDYAKFLLRNTDKTVNEIASLIGYANESSFYKLFRSYCDITPQEFRSRHQKNTAAPND